jgi:hypothetical protein
MAHSSVWVAVLSVHLVMCDFKLPPRSRWKSVGCPETSVRNCHNSLRNNPEEQSSLSLLVFCIEIHVPKRLYFLTSHNSRHYNRQAINIFHPIKRGFFILCTKYGFTAFNCTITHDLSHGREEQVQKLHCWVMKMCIIEDKLPPTILSLLISAVCIEIIIGLGVQSNHSFINVGLEGACLVY